ncbi:MAG TPA: FAD-dependent oxidoreductase, partial [Nitrococcus sp.]|nr:FAD-dependent oxidoreductase [Nitrococcus sp.]
IGLPVQYVDEAPVPFKIAGAARLDEQLQFHPQRYVRALAARIPGEESTIFEMTRALHIDGGSPNRVVTDHGTLTARDVVIATNIPFPIRGFYFAKVYPRAHVVMAVRIGQATAPGGMFISTDSPSFSVRAFRTGESSVLIATGGGFHPGRGDVAQHYRALREYVQRRFDVQEELCWWSNEDYDSMDRLPFVGCIARDARIYVATGFSAWGLSNGTAAAQILADRILGTGKCNELAAAFSARRWNPRASARRFTLGNAYVAQEFVQGRLKALGVRQASELEFDEAALVRHNGRLVAAYKDTAGVLRTWSPRCPHMGCLLRWNQAEQTWDCSCHGSRFRRDGRLLHGPAVRDMKAYESSPRADAPPGDASTRV